MGQVPSYGIIGHGRVGRHFSHYFELESIPFYSWSRNSPIPLEIALSSAEIILLCVSDGAIEKVIDDHPFLSSRKLVHFSGSHISKWAWGAHPLMTFSNRLYDLEVYRKISFVVEMGRSFSEIFPTLKNPFYFIDQKDKDLYHALCVLSGNFTSILWSKMFDTLENQLHIPRQAAFLYLDQVGTNLKELGSESITGPLVRRDIETVKKNLKALNSDPFRDVYRAVANIYLAGAALEGEML